MSKEELRSEGLAGRQFEEFWRFSDALIAGILIENINHQCFA